MNAESLIKHGINSWQALHLFLAVLLGAALFDSLMNFELGWAATFAVLTITNIVLLSNHSVNNKEVGTK